MKVLLIGFLFCSLVAGSQPYLDIVNMRYQRSPDAGISSKNNSNDFNYYNISLNLPFVFKKDSSMIVFSPFADNWDITGEGGLTDLADRESEFQSLALPLTGIIPLSAKWSIGLTTITRWNGYKDHWFENSFQFGASVLTTYKKSNTLRYKFGVYYNGEFSGAFIVPLAGIDWQIDEKNTLFGVLPGHLVFEHKVSKSIYVGASYRSINNTYRAGFLNNSTVPKYIRIQDNQVALFADLYLAKKVAFSLEAGHSAFKRLRLGTAHRKYFFEDKMNDNLLLKASLAYRLRLR